MTIKEWRSQVLKVAFTGRKYSGKTTTADVLCERTGAVKASFADGVKRDCAYMLAYNYIRQNEKGPTDWDRMQKIYMEMNDPATKELYRGFLQWYGTEYAQSVYGQLHWVNKTLEDIRVARETYKRGVVIDDMRFDHEAYTLRRRDYVIVHLESNPALTNDDTHASEQGIDAVATDLFLAWMPVEQRVDIIIDHLAKLNILREPRRG